MAHERFDGEAVIPSAPESRPDPVESARIRGFGIDDAIAAARRLAPTALELFPGAEVYLYGSYAKGTATPSSDIDFAVIIDSFYDYAPKEYFARKAALGLAACDVDDRIEAVVRARGDVSGFVGTILRTGIRIA